LVTGKIKEITLKTAKPEVQTNWIWSGQCIRAL